MLGIRGYVKQDVVKKIDADGHLDSVVLSIPCSRIFEYVAPRISHNPRDVDQPNSRR